MLKNVLREIDKYNGFSKSIISNNLNISEPMVDELIDQLIRMDYLREITSSANCDVPCGSCPYAKSCNFNPVKMYKISAKGNRLLK